MLRRSEHSPGEGYFRDHGADLGSLQPGGYDPVYLRCTISNGSQGESHYVCIDEEEELEMFHANDWDYEHFLHLQLDYDDADMEGTHDVITQAVWETRCHIIHGDCLIRSMESSKGAGV